MHLIADIPGPDDSLEHPTLAYVTSSTTSRLLSVVVDVGTKRLVAAERVGTAHPADQEQLYRAIEAIIGDVRRAENPSPVLETHLVKALAAFREHLRPRRRRCRGGLSPAQLRIATATLGSNLSGDVVVAHVAAACRVSEGHFSRAFRVSTGVSPTRWRLEQRLHFCRQRLVGSDDALSVISAQAGFPEQSYFSRVFARTNGMCPSEWRRIFKGASLAPVAA
ncbi:helix-turn-helix transcriptional regulator [Luteibacter pinisoli]|uniref:Helix-turn-helix transcriptional regulator n=1 Tax=Luteibacter pinisoli TaxID=2589080 RepID=A0A4Y5Z429_9GAMM|nr:AraC family transcriptional regulator [Luteibacter pinisoli]QDE39844.1 helix-turn-helix transcriptional regulator [Luteibacter pinisoli]